MPSKGGPNSKATRRCRRDLYPFVVLVCQDAVVDAHVSLLFPGQDESNGEKDEVHK